MQILHFVAKDDRREYVVLIEEGGLTSDEASEYSESGFELENIIVVYNCDGPVHGLPFEETLRKD